MTNTPFRNVAHAQAPILDSQQQEKYQLTKQKDAKTNKPSSFQPRQEVADLVARFSEQLSSIFSLSVARRYRALPLQSENGSRKLIFATARASDESLKKELKFVFGAEEIVFEYAADELVIEAIELAYNDSDALFYEGVEAMQEVELSTLNALESQRTKKIEQEDPILKFINSLLYLACQRGASDVYITPQEGGIFVRYKIEGNIFSNDLPISSLSVHERLVRRLKVLANLESSLLGIVADGEFSWSQGLYSSNIRLAIIPTIWGDRVTLRVHSTRARKFQLSELSLQDEILNGLYAFAEGKPGLGIFAGPTGSGKTTLLYSLIQHLKEQGKEILTIEDPVEVIIPGISQCNVQSKRGFTFADAIRSMLRHDPDVIMIGEVRDEESAQAMVRAALTGHFVLTTTHASDTLGVVSRLLEFGIKESMIREAVKLIVCQNLLPRLCRVCRTDDPQGNGWVAHGCNSCSYLGSSGRVPINELMAGDIKLAKGRGSVNRNSTGANFISMTRSVELARGRGLIK